MNKKPSPRIVTAYLKNDFREFWNYFGEFFLTIYIALMFAFVLRLDMKSGQLIPLQEWA
jgi:hypothetical protein